VHIFLIIRRNLGHGTQTADTARHTFYRLLDSLRGTASCRPILLCLWCLEDNCSVILCFFVDERGYALTLLCIYATESLHRTSWQARSCEFLNYVACAWAMTCARWWGWQFTSNFMMIYPCYFIHLHLLFYVTPNSVQYYKMAPCGFFKTFLVTSGVSTHQRTCLSLNRSQYPVVYTQHHQSFTCC
jgi:hypothetical protein